MIRHWKANPCAWTASWLGQVDLRVAQLSALRDQDLALDQVDPGDDLGDGVLDLDPRVHLDEVEPCGVGVVEELDGPRVLVSDVTGQTDGGVAKLLADGGVEVRCGGDLDDLLMPSLDRAVALEQVDEVAVLVAEDLDFDVPGRLMNFSRKTSGTPNAAPASRRAWSMASSSPSADSTTRIPRPPPPIDALTITGIAERLGQRMSLCP